MIRSQMFSPSWEIKPLGEVVEFLDHLRRPITERDRKPGPYPYYGANGQQDSVAEYLFDEPLILLAEDGGYFGDPEKTIAYRIEGKCWVNNHAHVLRPKDNVDISFLCRQLERYDIIPLINGATRQKLTKSSASEIPVTLPPLKEQKRIAAILDKADAIRRKRQQAIKLADNFLRATFLDMFGDPIINPKDWKIRPLSKLCDVRDGTHDSPKYVYNGYPLVTSKNVKDGFIDFSDVSLISEKDFFQINKRSKVDIGDIIMPMIGTIGNPVIVDTNRPFAIKNVALIKFKDISINNRYILHLLKSSYFEWVIQKQNRGGTQKFISLGDIRSFPIPVPDENDLSKFDAFCHKLESLIIKKNDVGKNGNDLFKALIQRAFRGEL